MSRVGQIVYNLDSYPLEGGKISTGPSIYDELVMNNSEYGGRLTKLGIQATPGTHFILNGKDMIVGRSGIYELDEDIVITQLRFVRPKKYRAEDGIADQKLRSGGDAIKAAENNRASALRALEQKYSVRSIMLDEATIVDEKYVYDNQIYDDWRTIHPNLFETYKDNGDGTFSLEIGSVTAALRQLNKDYWSDYTDIQKDYSDAYDAAQDDLNIGLHGWYEEDGEGDLENVIIDFLY